MTAGYGVARGRLSELTGPPGSGALTLGLRVLAAALDLENARPRANRWSVQLGVSLVAGAVDGDCRFAEHRPGNRHTGLRNTDAGALNLRKAIENCAGDPHA